jgi:hypothetical protein
VFRCIDIQLRPENGKGSIEIGCLGELSMNTPAKPEHVYSEQAKKLENDTCHESIFIGPHLVRKSAVNYEDEMKTDIGSKYYV